MMMTKHNTESTTHGWVGFLSSTRYNYVYIVCKRAVMYEKRSTIILHVDQTAAVHLDYVNPQLLRSMSWMYTIEIRFDNVIRVSWIGIIIYIMDIRTYTCTRSRLDLIMKGGLDNYYDLCHGCTCTQSRLDLTMYGCTG